MKLRAIFSAMCSQLISAGRWSTSVEDVAVAGPRRQKANAVLIRFLSWTRLLVASVSNERMSANRNSVKLPREYPSANDSISKCAWRIVIGDQKRMFSVVLHLPKS
jgi:hypothetical protein